MEESRSRQQSTKDNAHASSFVHLLSTSALRVRDEPPGSSLLGSEGAGWDVEVQEEGVHGGGRIEEAR